MRQVRLLIQRSIQSLVSAPDLHKEASLRLKDREALIDKPEPRVYLTLEEHLARLVGEASELEGLLDKRQLALATQATLIHFDIMLVCFGEIPNLSLCGREN